jgi:hypothetical protein
VGYEDPSDLDALLGYRLPTWGYRTWTANFNLNGGGSESRLSGNKSLINAFNTDLNTYFTHYNESEICTRSLTATLGGDYTHRHSGSDTHEQSRHELSLDYNLDAHAHRYLADGPFSLRFGLGRGQRYRENITSMRNMNVTTEGENYHRFTDHKFEAGVGWGRMRDVVPLIRAQRLSERLAAMGYPRLTEDQVVQVAQVIATEYGYGRIFDRRNRHFWEDVMEPMTGIQLSPYEVFYLADVLNENVGTRLQGFELTTLWQYSGSTSFSSSSPEDRNVRDRLASLTTAWSRNLTLQHQVRTYIGLVYSFRNIDAAASENLDLMATLEHLWNVADRHYLVTHLRYRGNSFIDSETRNRGVSLGSEWRIYVEDQLSLTTRADLDYDWQRSPIQPAGGEDGVNQRWNWGFSVGLTYDLQRVLF